MISFFKIDLKKKKGIHFTNCFRMSLSSNFSASLDELSCLLQRYGIQVRLDGDGSKKVTDVAADSRRVTSGAIFVAVPGSVASGSEFIWQAKERGAVAVVVKDNENSHGLAAIRTNEPRKALAYLSVFRYSNQDRNLKIGAVTGTNGKSTTAWIAHSLLTSLGYHTLLIGTLGVYNGIQKLEESALTTPDSLTVQRLIAEHHERGGTHIILEASSHALDQFRLDGINFSAVGFTNLTRDHADYHPTMEDYYQAKKRLFELADQSKTPSVHGIIVYDAPYGSRLACEFEGRLSLTTISCAKNAMHGVSGVKMQYHIGGNGKVIMTFEGESYELESPFLGDFNAANLLTALGICRGLGADISELVRHVSLLPQVPGRLEKFQSEENITVFVDYAHTPDALERVLSTLRKLASGSLVVVFGCGGGRDLGKRPLMGEIATRLADRVVVTSDNPRNEHPEQIINQILSGISAEALGRVEIDPDRQKAIETAIRLLRSDDILVVAGKGHEDYQIIGEKKIHFSDQEIVQAALNLKKH